MKKSVAVMLVAFMILGIFSACRSPEPKSFVEENNSSAPSVEYETEGQVSVNRASTSGVTAHDVYAWTQRACYEAEIEDLSPMTTEDELVEFFYLANAIVVVCACEDGYVTEVISACYDKGTLDLAFSDTDYLSVFLKVLAFPIYKLGNFDDPFDLVTELVIAEEIEMDGKIIRACKANNWLFTLTILNSEESVGVTAYYMGEDDNADVRICEQCGTAEPEATFHSAKPICDVCLVYNAKEQNQDEDHIDTDYSEEISCEHRYTEATCVAAETCIFCGETRGIPAGHDYASGTCTEPRTCRVCDETEGSAPGHDYLPATCEDPKTCWVCGETKGDALGHDYSPATCEDPKTCWVCGETTGSALGHDYLSATCEDPKICRVCGERTGYALGHDYTDPTCTEPGMCRTCGDRGMMPVGHEWERITEEVYHEEQGHYGEVEIAVKVNEYRCFFCMNPTYRTLDAYYSHFDSAHGDELNASHFRERYDIVERWAYEYETQWIVDVPAYTETVTIGHQCRVCGEEK